VTTLTVDELIASRATPCRTCGRTIVFASTRKSKSMPVDVAPAADGNVELVIEHGLLYADVHGQPPIMPTVLRHSHMETCPHRDRWKGRR
jgi:hypothetical protein